MATAPLKYNSSPKVIQAAIQTAIEAELALPFDRMLDAAPKVLVTGNGTKSFPWRIEFKNTGKTALSISQPAIGGLSGIGSKPGFANPNSISANWATGIPSGKTMKGVTHVIGSSKDDVIFGASRHAKLISKFSLSNGAANILDGKIRLPGDVKITTGQAVLYKSADAASAIKGLRHEQVYFVKVDKELVNGQVSETRLTFYEQLDGVGLNTKNRLRRPVQLASPGGGG